MVQAPHKKNSLENPPCSRLLHLPFFVLSVQMQFVSMNTKYPTLVEALARTDGLDVLAVFMEVTFYFKWFFRHDEGTSRLYKFNSKQILTMGPLWIFLLGINCCDSKHLHSKFFPLLELR